MFIQKIFDPSFPRAHHPIIRDSTSIWELTGLVLVQLGNRSFRDSCIQVCKSRLLEAPSFQSPSFFLRRSAVFAEYSLTWALPTCPVEIGFATLAASAKSSFSWYQIVEFTTHIAKFRSSVVDSSVFLSFPFLSFVLPKSIVVSTIQIERL